MDTYTEDMLTQYTADEETATYATNLTPIEVLLRVDEDGTVSAKNVYEFLALRKADYSRWCKSNIEENTFAEENVDFWAFRINAEWGGQATTDYRLKVSFAKKLCMKQGNERGEQARGYFVKVEESYKNAQLALNELSPQLQLLIQLETMQNRQAAELTATNKRIDDIRDVVALNPNDWRRESADIINRTALSVGGYEHIKPIRTEIYQLIDDRYGVSLQTRLTNRRRRMAEEGVSKSKRDKLTIVDVIADDKKLIEAYVNIVKEVAIRNGVGLSDISNTNNN